MDGIFSERSVLMTDCPKTDLPERKNQLPYKPAYLKRLGATLPALVRFLSDIMAGTEALQQEIVCICDSISKAEDKLDAAEQAGDAEKVKFQRNILEQLVRERVLMREEKTIILRSLSVAGGICCWLYKWLAVNYLFVNPMSRTD